MKFQRGISFSKTDLLGRLESTVCIQEKTDDDLGFGMVLCSCNYVGIELDEAIRITEKYFIKSLNKNNDRISNNSTK